MVFRDNLIIYTAFFTTNSFYVRPSRLREGLGWAVSATQTFSHPNKIKSEINQNRKISAEAEIHLNFAQRAKYHSRQRISRCAATYHSRKARISLRPKGAPQWQLA